MEIICASAGFTHLKDQPQQPHFTATLSDLFKTPFFLNFFHLNLFGACAFYTTW